MNRKLQLAAAALGTAAGLAGLSGCGQNASSTPTADALSQVAQSYESAQHLDDVATACALMSPRFQRQLLAIAGETDCPSLGQAQRMKEMTTDRMVASRVGESMIDIRRQTKVDVRTTVTDQSADSATVRAASTVTYVGSNAKVLGFVFGGKRSQTKTATLTMKYEGGSWGVDADSSITSRH